MKTKWHVQLARIIDSVRYWIKIYCGQLNAENEANNVFTGQVCTSETFWRGIQHRLRSEGPKDSLREFLWKNLEWLK